MIRLPHLTWPQRAAVAAGVAVVALVGGLAGPASAHDITGFSEVVACSPTAGLDWTFTSSNAGSHSIQTATFNRPTTLISQTATAVKVHTAEHPGETSLSITATFEDGHVSQFTASTVMLEGVCAPPATTPPPTTVPEVTTLPTPATTVPSLASLPPPATDARVEPTSVVASDTSIARTPTTTGAARLALPATGAGDWTLIIVAVGAFLLLVGLVLSTAYRTRNDDL